MGLIRILNPMHYDKDRQHFQSSCFSPSGDGKGISVIDAECAIRTSHTICQHIERYYSRVAGEPVMYWLLPHDLPSEVTIEPSLSDSGDFCHRNLHNLTHRRTRRGFFRQSCRLKDIRICTNGTEIAGSKELLDRLVTSTGFERPLP